MNSVAYIKSLGDESKATEAVRAELKKLGPPRPTLIVAIRTPEKLHEIHHENFNTEFYELAEWLCGCSQQNALFCYICLVMSTDSDKFCGESYRWIRVGVTSEITCKPKLLEKVNKHQTTSQHMTFNLDYALLGENNALHHLENEFFLNVTPHNEKVRLNCYILSKLIDCVKCTTSESDYRAEMKQVLIDHGALVSDIFRDSFESIWSELLNSIHAVCVSLIHQEIERTDFVSLEVDEVNSVGSPVILVFVVRYELQGQIHERFLKSIITESIQIWNMHDIVLHELRKLAVFNEKAENFISISYNGLASIFTKSGIQYSKLKTAFKKIHFIHSYAHNINFVIERTGSLDKELSIFFINLKSFQTFFVRFEEYISNQGLNLKFQDELKFQETSLMVITLCAHKSDIHECLDKMIDVSVERSTLAEAVALKNVLTDSVFNFWLDFFSKVLPICNEFMYVIQREALDADQVNTVAKDFKTKMHNVKNGYAQKSKIKPPPSKRPCLGEVVYIKEEINHEQIDELNEFTRVKVANKVFNVIMTYIEERIRASPFLLLDSLVHPVSFGRYRLAFPRTNVEEVSKVFCLDKEALTAELLIIYDRAELSQAEGALFLLQYLYENHLTDIFPEVLKLLKMICTVPMTTSEPERCFDTLKQIKSFVKSTYGQEKANILTMCLVEKDLMKTAPDFNEMVIDHFCRHSKEIHEFFRICLQRTL